MSICMVTQRESAHEAFRCGIYECQDILIGAYDVEWIEPKPRKYFELAHSLQCLWMYHDFTGRASRWNITFRPVELAKEYELFIAYCHNPWDLLPISAIRDWKNKCNRSLCWIEELWGIQAQEYRWMWPILKQFDHVVLGLNRSVKVLSDIIGKQCHFVAPGVDAIRFSPYPTPPARVIDIYSIGRRWQALHQTALSIAKKNNLFYVFDTFTTPSVGDYREHREMFANMAKRSRYMFVAPAKMNRSDETMGQVEMPYRLFESSAAGAVMLGQAPGCESFREFFDWPDAVIEIQPDGSDLHDVLAGLAATPDRLLEISRRNVKEALLRHDWIYRWKQIFQIAGIDLAPNFKMREMKLRKLAKMVNDEKSFSAT